jgi:hypothetical protein
MPKPATLASLLLLPLASALVAGCASRPEAHAVVPAESYLANVAWLADDARRGRDTGMPELTQAAEWIAEQFDEAGLEPLGDDGGWLQGFSVKGQRRLVEGNALRLAIPCGATGSQTALSGAVEAEVVFAATASAIRGRLRRLRRADEGQIVLVLRRGELMQRAAATRRTVRAAHMSLATKVNAASARARRPARGERAGLRARLAQRSDDPLRHARRGLGHGLAAGGPAPAGGAGLWPQQAWTWRRGRRSTPQPQSRPLPGSRRGDRRRGPQIATSNVLGAARLDPALAHEYVVVGAHMDHGSRPQPRPRGGSGARTDPTAPTTTPPARRAIDRALLPPIPEEGVGAARHEPPRRPLPLADWCAMT